MPNQASGDEGAVTARAEISRVSVKAPPFWKQNPALWFVQLESQFVTSGITQDSSKFHVAVAAMDTAILAEVSDIILQPPAADKFGTLRRRLQERFTDSEQTRLKRLLCDIELGDKRPSQLLRQMNELSEGRFPADALKSLWMSRLPTQTQAILSTNETAALDDLAKMADKISEVVDHRSINEVRGSQDGVAVGKIAHLEQMIEELSTKFKDFSGGRYRSTARGSSRGRRGNTPGRSKSRSGVCWYHRVFAEKSTKCRDPCNFQSKK